MAIPAIIGVAARSAGASLVSGARFAGKASYNGLKAGIVRGARGAIAAQRNEVLNRALGVYDSISAARAARREQERTSRPLETQTEGTRRKNQEKAEKDERENQLRQEKAHADALGDKTQEQTSVLKVISKDTKDILAGIELLVEEGISGNKKKEGGLLSGLMSLLAGLTVFSKGFLGSLGAFFTKMASKVGSTIAAMVSRAFSGVMGTLARAGSGIARTAGTVGKAALTAGGALAAKAGLASRGAAATGPAVARAAGTTGGIVGKAAGRSALKKIPVIGAGVGLALAANRAASGDWAGAGLEATSGALSLIPGLGTAASLGVDAAIVARDLKRAGASGTSAPDFSNVQSGSSSIAAAQNASVLGANSSSAKSRVENLLESLVWTMRAMFTQMTTPYKGIYTQASDAQAKFDWENFFRSGGSENRHTGTTALPNESDSYYKTDSNRSTLEPLSTNSSLSASGDAKELLDLIAKGESGAAGYDAVWSGSRLKPDKPISQMTFGEVKEWQRATLNEQKSRGIPANRRSSAAGRYQFISSTLASMQSAAGIRDDELFSPENQDKLALALLNADKNRGLDAWRSGKASDADFINYVASQWASFKGTSGRGLYDAPGFNAGKIDGAAVISAANNYRLAPARQEAPIASQMRDSVVENTAAWRAPMIISQPVPVPTQQKAPSGGTGASVSPMITRNPDTPIQQYAVAILGAT